MPESYDNVDFDKCKNQTYGDISDCYCCPIYKDCKENTKRHLESE